MSLSVTPTATRKTKTDETSPDEFVSGRRKSERRVKIPNNFGEYDVTISVLKKKQDDSDERMGSGSDEDSDDSASARTNKSSKNANNDADSEPRPSKGKERSSKSKKSKAQDSDEPSRKSNKKSKAASKSDDEEDVKEEDDGSGNHDQCDACGDGGSLLCCDACPRAFHIDCCPLPLDRNALPDKWFCHQCILEIQKKPDDPNMPFLKGEILAYAALCLSAKRLGDAEKKRDKEGKTGPFSAIYLGLGVTNPRSYQIPNAAKKMDRRSEVRYMQFKDIMKNPEMGKQRYATEDKLVDTRNRQKSGPECNVCGCGPVTDVYRAKPIEEPDRFDVFGLLKCSLCDRRYHTWCLDTFFLEAHSWSDGTSTDFDWTCPRHRIPDPNEDSKHLPAYRRLDEMVQPTAPLYDPSVVSNYILLDSYLPYFLNYTPFTIPIKRLPKEEKPFYQKPYVVQLTSDPSKIAAAPMYYAAAPDANMSEGRSKRERARNSYEEKKKELASRDTFKSLEKTQRANVGKDEMLKLMMQKMNVDLSQFVMPLSDANFVEDMTDQFEEELDDIFSQHPRLKKDYEYLQGINRGMKQLAECQRLTRLIPSRPRRVQALKDIKKMKFAKREELFGTHMNMIKTEVDAILSYITPKELLAYFPLGDSKSLGEPSDSTTSTRAAAQMANNLRKSGNGENNNEGGENGDNYNDNTSNGNNNAGSGGDDDKNNKRKGEPDQDNGGDDDDEDNEDQEGEIAADDDDDWEVSVSGDKDKKRKSNRGNRALRKSGNTIMSDATQPESVMSIEKTEPATEQQSEERLRQMQSLLWANMSPVFLQFLAWQRLVDIGQHLERAQQIATVDSNDDRVQKILNEAHKQDDMIATHMTWLDTWKNNLDMQQQVINPRPTKRARPKTENDDDEPPNKRRKQDKSESPNTGSLSGNITATMSSMYNLPAPSISPPVTPTPAAGPKKAALGTTVNKPIAPAGPVALLPKPALSKGPIAVPTRGPAKAPFTRAANLPRDTKPPNGQTKHTWKVPLPDQPIRGAIASLSGVSEFDSQPFQFNMFAHKISIGRGMPILEFDVAKYTDCKTISHKHASIEFSPDKKCFIFNNLGRNGTRINEEQIGGKLGINIPLVLYPGDVIEMGRFRMTFTVYKSNGFETIYDQGPPPE